MARILIIHDNGFCISFFLQFLTVCRHGTHPSPACLTVPGHNHSPNTDMTWVIVQFSEQTAA